MPSSSPVAPGYSWDERAGRYRSQSGKFVSSNTIREACHDTAQASRDNMARLAGELRSGNLTLAEWQSGMMREIKTVHTAEAAAARGGWAQMSQSDWGATGNLIRKQYEYLDGMAIEIENGKQPLNGRLDARAKQYGQAGYGTFEQMERRYQENDNGMTEERRTLHAQESCQDCIDIAARGWVAIGTLPRIGDSRCRTNCACVFEYRRPDPAGGWITVEAD